MLHFLEIIFGPLISLFTVVIYYPFLNILRLIIAAVPGHNAFWGILGLTLLVRLALIVPSRKAAESQRKLNELQPKISELKAEYGNDRNGFAVAQMALYKENDINPFASCLPLLIQLPLLIILYQAILHGLSTNPAHIYGWVPKVTDVKTHFLWYDLLRPDRFDILPILIALLQLVQVRMLMPPLPPPIPGQAPDPAVMAQRQSMFVAPLMYLIIGFKLPAGADFYIIITTVFTIIQQYFVNKEKLKITGVEKALKEGAAEHPENVDRFEKVKEIVEKSQSSGVNVTVRRKK